MTRAACIGVDLGGTKISGVVLDMAGAELARVRAASPRDDYQATLDAVVAVVADLEARAGLGSGTALVGVGAPGTWQPRLQCMKNCNSTWLNGRPLLHDLLARLGARVRIANDADCLALSEAADGAGTGAASVFGAILGTGVGGALVVGGELLQGPNGLAGEWGHTPLPYLRSRVFSEAAPAEQARFQLESRLDDRLCYCGRFNCIETFLSGPGLAAMHQELWHGSMTAEAITASDSPAALASFEVYQHMLARSLAQVVNLLDPGVIVLGGGVSNANRLPARLAELIPGYAFSAAGHQGSEVQVSVRAARWGDDSGVRGAARLWSGE